LRRKRPRAAQSGVPGKTNQQPSAAGGSTGYAAARRIRLAESGNRTLDRIGSAMIGSVPTKNGAIMADDKKERTARNRALLARMGAPPTKAQVLTELDLEINDATNLAVAADLPTLVRLLRMAKLELDQIRRRSEFKDKS
jgi:hypothetical protein